MEDNEKVARKPFVFSMQSMAEEGLKNAPSPIAEGFYVAEVFDAGMVSEPDGDWDKASHSYIPNGKTRPRLEIVTKILTTITGQPVLNTRGEEPRSNLITIFPRLDMNNLGYIVKSTDFGKPTWERKVLTALYGVPLLGTIPEGSTDDLIGKKIILSLSVVPKKNGALKNVIDKVTPYVESTPAV